jgi:hypothetical protein
MLGIVRRIVVITLFSLASGCSFKIEPVNVTTEDLGEDLSVQPVDDLSVAATDAQDLQTPTDLVCVPPIFPGFGAGASSPFDCTRCGCVVDDLTNNSDGRWTRTASSGWTDSISGGTLTMTGSMVNNFTSDIFSSESHFYLQGDFDLLVDYQVSNWPSGGGFELIVQSPPGELGAAAPVATAHTYSSSGMTHLYMRIDSQTAQDTVTTATSGTYEISRVANTLCASRVGGTPKCGTLTLPSALSVVLEGSVTYNSSCSSSCTSSCCNFQAQFSNLRLKSGTIVQSP